MNYEQVCLELLAQDNFLQINKKLLANLGLEKAVFIAYLIDKYKYLKKEGKLKDDYFYSTDSDILLFSGLKLRTIQNIKKEGEKMGLFSIKKEGIPAKTFYKINFYKINKLLFSQKTIDELSYERLLQNNISFQEIDYDLLEKLSLKQLHLFCKQNKVSYSGNYTKDELIKKILFKKNEEKNNRDRFSFSKDEILKMNFRTLREICKKLNITYSGNDNKENLRNKLLELFNKEEVDKIVSKKSDNKWTNKLTTSEQKSCNKLKQNIKTKKQKQITTTSSSSDRYDFLDLEEFNLLNKGTIKNIRNNIENLDLKKFKEIYHYVKNKFDSGKVNNFNGFLYELLNKEWDINIQSEEVEKKEVSGDKKKWLNYYSGIINNIELKEEVEKIIIDIPLEVLQKNKSKLGSMGIFEFKQYLYTLKNLNKVS